VNATFAYGDADCSADAESVEMTDATVARFPNRRRQAEKVSAPTVGGRAADGGVAGCGGGGRAFRSVPAQRRNSPLIIFSTASQNRTRTTMAIPSSAINTMTMTRSTCCSWIGRAVSAVLAGLGRRVVRRASFQDGHRKLARMMPAPSLTTVRRHADGT
jgi:hypothetical protein